MKTIADFAAVIRALSTNDLDNAHPLPEALLIEREGALSVYYAPFDYVNVKAELVLVGITPGRTQAKLALHRASEALRANASEEEAIRLAKSHASFGGPMRSNLVRMLDCIGLNQRFGLQTCADLFVERTDLVHFTSALQYPVFVDGRDYNGTPRMSTTPFLRRYVERYMTHQLNALPQNALLLPLGPKPTEALVALSQNGQLDRRRILAGLPHPSGANAERVAVFCGSKDPSAASVKTDGPALLAAKANLIEVLRESRQ